MKSKEGISVYTLAGLVILLLVAFLLLQLTAYYTKDSIADNRLEATRRVFDDIIPTPYNNEIFNDSIKVIEPDYLGGRQVVTLYRARNNGGATGVLIHPVIAPGYNDDIKLGIGITRSGEISGVVVTQENETEGLGDRINQHKSGWLEVFDGLSLDKMPPEQWRVKNEQGYFDQVSGATITSRSVINAVRNALEYHNIAGDTIYSP